MLSKPQYLYQTKLIIDCFPKEDYESIPKETLKYIEDNMQVDSNIVINPDISLEEQDIDPQTWQLLQKIADDVSDREFYEEYKKYDCCRWFVFIDCLQRCFYIVSNDSICYKYNRI